MIVFKLALLTIMISLHNCLKSYEDTNSKEEFLKVFASLLFQIFLNSLKLA